MSNKGNLLAISDREVSATKMEMGFLFEIRVEKPKIHVSEHFSLYSAKFA